MLYEKPELVVFDLEETDVCAVSCPSDGCTPVDSAQYDAFSQVYTC